MVNYIFIGNRITAYRGPRANKLLYDISVFALLGPIIKPFIEMLEVISEGSILNRMSMSNTNGFS